MFKKVVILTLLAVMTSLFLTACASTEPNSLTGKAPVYNDKGRIVDYR